MSVVSELTQHTPHWLNSPGETEGIAISSRVRLARNLRNQQFRRQLSDAAQADLVATLNEMVDQALDWPERLRIDLPQIGAEERQALLERRLISRELSTGSSPSGLVVRSDEQVGLMLNEEDHVRLQAVQPGLAVEAALAQATEVDQRLETHLPWAIHDRYGYLTSCPTNTGTGLRASVMLHLPALAETRELAKALRAIGKVHMTVRGQYGEGSEAAGHYYQVSNQRTLGMSEADIASALGDTVDSLITYERLARQALLARRRSRIEDKVFRAWGLLTHARRLTSAETTEQLSWLRLGVAMNMLEVDWATLDRLFIATEPAHMQLAAGAGANAEHRDEARASLVRAALAN